MNSPAPTSLPTETLSLIFRNFCLHCRAEHQPTAPDAYFRGTQQDPDSRSWYSLERQTLFSLCLVSRRLRDIAQPILYHEFVPGYGDSWRSALYTWDKRLTSFMRTVARRCDLAALVKRVYVHPYLLRAINDEEAEVALEESARGLAVSLPEYRGAFRAASREPVNAYLRSQLIHAELMGLLLAQLPNLDRLSLQTHGGVPSSALRAAGVAALSLNTFDMCADSFGHVEQGRRAMFHLAYQVGGILEMATLNLHMCGGAGDVPFRLSQGTLRITHSRLGEEDLGRLLALCDGLDTFVYEAANGDMRNGGPIDEGSDHFVPTDAIRHLVRHRETLKSLYLDLRNRDYAPPGYPTYLPISSLKDFIALENLLLNSTAICNTMKKTPSDYGLLARLLPPNIVSLRVVDIGAMFSRLSKGLIGLAEAVLSGMFPRLRIVKCDTQLLFYDFPGAELFASVRIDYGFENWPYSWPTLLESHFPPQPSLSEMPPMPLPTGDEDPDL